MNRYTYNGPVWHFEHIVAHNFNAVTSAKSAKQALNNFMFRAKKQYGFTPGSKIILSVNDLKQIEE